MLIPNKHSGYRAGQRLYPKKDAAAPDPNIGAASREQVQLNREIYNDYAANERPWMKDLANRAIDISEGNAERSQALSDYQLGMMKYNDERWRSVAVPFENELLEDSRRFDSDAYKQQQVDAARADVGAAFDQMGLQAGRTAGRFGIDRVVRASTDVGLEKAKAMASAANKTRQAAEQVGLATKMQMYGGMKGLAGLGNANAGLALSGVGTAQGAAGGIMGAASGYLSANNAAQGAMNSGVSAGLNAWNSYDANRINAANVNAQNDPFNTILGAAAGVGTSWAMGKFL